MTIAGLPLLVEAFSGLPVRGTALTATVAQDRTQQLSPAPLARCSMRAIFALPPYRAIASA
jgi:hypothetical protein